MKTLKEFLQALKEKRIVKRKKRLEMTANNMFQVTEYNGGLWLVFDGRKVAPFSIITRSSDSDVASAMALITTLREMFVERNM